MYGYLYVLSVLTVRLRSHYYAQSLIPPSTGCVVHRANCLRQNSYVTSFGELCTVAVTVSLVLLAVGTPCYHHGEYEMFIYLRCNVRWYDYHNHSLRTIKVHLNGTRTMFVQLLMAVVGRVAE